MEAQHRAGLKRFLQKKALANPEKKRGVILNVWRRNQCGQHVKAEA